MGLKSKGIVSSFGNTVCVRDGPDSAAAENITLVIRVLLRQVSCVCNNTIRAPDW